MSELVKSFKPVDPETWQAALDAVSRFKDFFGRGHVLWDTDGKPITEVGQLTAAIQAGTWPRTPYKGRPVVILKGPPWKDVPMLAGEEAERQYAAWQALLERRATAEEGGQP